MPNIDHDALTAAIARLRAECDLVSDEYGSDGLRLEEDIRAVCAAAEAMATLERILRPSGLQAYGDDAVSAIHNLAAQLDGQEAQR